MKAKTTKKPCSNAACLRAWKRMWKRMVKRMWKKIWSKTSISCQVLDRSFHPHHRASRRSRRRTPPRRSCRHPRAWSSLRRAVATSWRRPRPSRPHRALASQHRRRLGRQRRLQQWQELQLISPLTAALWTRRPSSVRQSNCARDHRFSSRPRFWALRLASRFTEGRARSRRARGTKRSRARRRRRVRRRVQRRVRRRVRRRAMMMARWRLLLALWSRCSGGPQRQRQQPPPSQRVAQHPSCHRVAATPTRLPWLQRRLQLQQPPPPPPQQLHGSLMIAALVGRQPTI
mmetsp:Transcript_93815/g.235558  ORF Transcript_93815/g.235558 Transcript_93815/m.235558 type:complete len:288 (-) Transcript_93815:180-1043(-)